MALVALMLGFAALFVADYPPLSGIEDEVGFINQALVWSRGAVSAEGAGLPADLADFAPVPGAGPTGRHVAQRHPGRSLLALPLLMLGGRRAVYFSGLALHLALTVLAAAVLGRLGRSPLWAVLVLCHPTLALYSRTILGDAAAGAGLLLAALPLTAPGLAGAGAASGLAVGLAAAMRYHAGAALPFVAAAFRLPPAGRAHPGREAALCLLAGGLGGAAIVAYNLAVYGTPMDPFSAARGVFSAAYFGTQARFYATALLVIWPGMLLAPVLDRSLLRWLVRGTCGCFFLFFSCYYFHDQTARWLETLIVGQRLIQVALPLWVVSYAGVLDERAAPVLRRWLGPRARAGLVALACLGLLAGTGWMFRRHQAHLLRLQALRAGTIAAIPDGSLVVHHGPVRKLFGVPEPGLPSYRWRQLEYFGRPVIDPQELAREPRPWYLAVASKVPGTPPPATARALVERHRMQPVVNQPSLMIYRADPAQAPP